MTLIVHGRATSSNVQAVMWGAAELGLPVDRRDVGGRFGGTDTAAYRAMNPNGLVPVLQDGDLTLFESAAILRYLGERYGMGQLNLAPQADVWAEWGKGTLARHYILQVFWAHYRTPVAKRDTAAVAAAQTRFESLAAMAMAQRGAGPFMMGETLSLADIWIGHVLFRYFTLDLPRNPPAGLTQYYAALTDRPAFRAHVMVDYTELKAREDT